MNNFFNKVKEGKMKATAALMASGLAATTAMVPAFATSGAIFGNTFSALSGAFDEFYGGMLTLVSPVATAAAAYCLIRMMLSKDQKKVDTYKQWLMMIVVCIVVMYALKGIFGVAETFGRNLNLSNSANP